MDFGTHIVMHIGTQTVINTLLLQYLQYVDVYDTFIKRNEITITRTRAHRLKQQFQG